MNTQKKHWEISMTSQNQNKDLSRNPNLSLFYITILSQIINISKDMNVNTQILIMSSNHLHHFLTKKISILILAINAQNQNAHQIFQIMQKIASLCNKKS